MALAVAAFARQPAGYPFHVDFTVSETEGVARVGEPVWVEFPPDARAGNLSSMRLWNRTTGREEPVQADGHWRVLLLATLPAKAEIRYRLYYGGAGAPPAETDLRVTGDDLAWKVENRRLAISLEKNSGTGRNGQINTVFFKEPAVLFTRDRAASTLQLSPNAAASEHWAGVNRWDPPARYAMNKAPLCVRLEREGEMPRAPGLWVKVAYEFFAGAPFFAVEESVEARKDTPVALLRLCEWSFAPNPGNPFTHLAWEDASGRVTRKERGKEEKLPADVRWAAFVNLDKRFGLAAAIERFTPGTVLRDSALRFGGEPAHYFYWILIHSPEERVTIPRAASYAIRYWVYCFRPGEDATAPVSEFSRAARHRLRVRMQ